MKITHSSWTIRNILIKFCTHWYWQDLGERIAKCHLSSVEALPRSKFWKENMQLALSIEPYGIFWWNFAADTLVLTRASPGNIVTEIPFTIGRGFAGVQTVKLDLYQILVETFWFFFFLHTHWYWQDLVPGIAKCHFHLTRLCRGKHSKKV